MSWEVEGVPPPEGWEKFLKSIRMNAPIFPIVQPRARQERAQRAGRAINVASAASDGLNLPGPVGTAVTVAGAVAGVAGENDASSMAGSLGNSAFDAGVGHFAGQVVSGAGAAVGGLLGLLRGADQALDRTDQMVDYLGVTTGFVTTLARTCASEIRRSSSDVYPPASIVPSYIERSGTLYTHYRRQLFERGYWKAQRMCVSLNQIRVESGSTLAKQGMTHLAMLTRRISRDASNDDAIRMRAEEIIVRDILGFNMTQRRRQLMEWANAA